MVDLIFESKEVIQIDVKDLKIGMYVCALDRPWLESSFLFQGFLLKTKEDIEAVQKQCGFVFIDTSRQINVSRYSAADTTYTEDYLTNVEPLQKRSSFKQELKAAEVVHRKTSSLVKSFMEDVQFGRPINVVAAKEAVSNCVDSILNSPDALLLMTQLKSRDEYTAQHSMNVCIFSIALGRHIGLQEFELNNIGLCGMMHDMGKMYIPSEVLNKPGRLTAEEMEIMKTHTTRGWKLLVSTNGMYPGAMDAILST